MINGFRLPIFGLFCMLSAACSGDNYDADASRCYEQGYQPGTERYEACMQEEKMQRMLNQQREMEERQQIRERQEQSVPRL